VANLLRYLKTASSTNDDAVNGYSIGSVDNDGRGSSSCGISNTCSARKRHYCKQSQQLWYYVLEHQVIHKLQLQWGRSSKKSVNDDSGSDIYSKSSSSSGSDSWNCDCCRRGRVASSARGGSCGCLFRLASIYKGGRSISKAELRRRQLESNVREIGSGKRSRFIFNRQEQQGHKLHLASDSWNENFEPAGR